MAGALPLYKRVLLKSCHINYAYVQEELAADKTFKCDLIKHNDNEVNTTYTKCAYTEMLLYICVYVLLTPSKKGRKMTPDSVS